MDPLTRLNVVAAVFGTLVLVFSSASRILKERVFLSEPVVGLAVGVILGPYVVGVMPEVRGETLADVAAVWARFAVGVQLTATALRLPDERLRRPRRTVFVLIGTLMPLMWACASLLAWSLLDVTVTSALVLGAIVTPTDPVLATSILTGSFAERHLPAWLREDLSAESAANDGLAFLFVLLPLLLIDRPAQGALTTWIVRGLLRDVVCAIAIGVAFGWVAARLLLWSTAHDASDKRSFLVFAVAFTLLNIGVVRLLGADSLIAIFAGAAVFSVMVKGPARERLEQVQHVLDVFTTLSTFMLFGAVLPWAGWVALGWRGLIAALAIVVLRRLPATLALKPALGCSWPEAFVMGWVGPIGIGALFYAALVVGRRGNLLAWNMTTLVVTGSVLVHGLSAVPIAKAFRRWDRRAERGIRGR